MLYSKARSIRGLFTGLCWMAAVVTHAQDFKLKSPELLPPTPEVASLIQAGYGSLSRNTGAITASIPIYELKVRGFSWPIGLSYSSQGLKIDEACSRVGNGWTLNANGVISRMVKDEPDDVSQKLPVPVSLGAVDTATLHYAYNAAGSFDSEYDIYHFSFNGNSGKMVFNDSNQAILTSHSNLRVERIGWHSFVMTTTDGIKYYFGNAYERTITHNLDIATGYKNNTRTAYFLDRIELPDGGWINFSYTQLDMNGKSGTSETATKNAQSSSDPCQVCPAGGQESFSEQSGYIEYRTQYLTGITTSSGQSVTFFYEAKPDLSGDKRLKQVHISAYNHTLKDLELDYYDPPGFTGGTTQISRFFLTKISEPGVSDVAVQEGFKLQHSFTYYDLANLGGTPYSKQQDYFGFYNGNTGNLLTADGIVQFGSVVNGNRTSNPELAKKGILTSIKYPTGGSEVFEYEPNTLPVTTQHTYPKFNVHLSGFFQGGQTSYTYASNFFFVPFSQTVPVNLESIYTNGTPNYLEGERVVQFYIKKDGDTVIHEIMNGNATKQLQVLFEPSHTYQVLMRIRQGAYDGGSIDLSYDTTTATYSTVSNSVTGGLRLRKVSYLDKPGSVAKKKFFTYASVPAIIASQGGTLISAGSGHTRAYFSATAYYSIWCSNEWGSYAICPMNVLSTNSAFNTQDYEGSPVNYSVVVESDDSLFVNGCTEYVYNEYDQASNNEALRGDDAAAVARGNYGTLNGVLDFVNVYDKNFNLVATQHDIYQGSSVPDKTLYSYFIQQKYQPILNSPILEREVDAFNIVRYRHWDRWIKKLATVSKRYEQGKLIVDSTAYVYNAAANILPQQTIKIGSRGEELKTTFTYPTDAPGTGIFPAMIAANQIAAPYETSFLVNNVLQQQKRTKYKNLRAQLFAVDTILLKSTPADLLNAEQYFSIYDSAGNPQQFNKAGDIPLTFLWDHDRSLVTAQIKNAQLSQVAYTSFEGDSWGNWKPDNSSALINLDGGYTGSNSFTGILRDTLSGSGQYRITLWAKTGTPTVNGAAGTTVTFAAGWTLYQWSLSNPTVVTVNGTKIDEVRLLPADAEMTTAVHIPFVGVAAQCDVNNKVVRYEYDGFNRLYRIRDEENNIVKQVCYNYAGQLDACSYKNVFYSRDTSIVLSRNNCGTNGTGHTMTYVFEAGRYVSSISQADADQQLLNELANAQTLVNATAGCTWSSQAQTASFTKNDCNTGQTGSVHSYTIGAGAFTSTQSLAQANALALTALGIQGQQNANLIGTCTGVCNGSPCTGIDKKCINNICETGIKVNTACEAVSGTQNRQYYHYEWSDGSWSVTYSELTSEMCAVD